MRLIHWLRRLALSGSLLAVSAFTASPAVQAQVAVPPELRGWADWALHGHETHRCPWLVPGQPADDARVCAWPSVLEVQVDERAARFSQRWQVAAESWLPLPGSEQHWPEDVTLDGTAAALVNHGGSPALHVAPGVHAVAGIFRWTRRPELLPLPPNVALVSLSIGGGRALNPQRTDAGVVLGAHAIARHDARVDVRVFRQLADDLPSRLTTQVQLAIAGEAREIRLAGALPAGFVPTAIESALAARVDPDNTLRVQVRPGEFTLTLEARGPSPLAEVHLGARELPWPADEVWSFKGEDRLRVAAVEGVVPIDPAQANVPQDWRDLPAFRLNATAVLRVAERSRGSSAQDGNELRLQRTAWLDFSGAGYTIVDELTGAMRRDWRLDMAAPYALRSARSGPFGALLITSGATPGLSGVELRAPQVSLTALSQVERTQRSLPATGWRTRVSQVSGQLILPPGYRLLAAFGPDLAPQAWLERWRLLDIFAVLLTATVAWRILGARAALIALAALALTYQESGAPSWLWLAVLLALALQHATPEGRLRGWAAGLRVLALVVLVIALIPFVITQARLAVYPQLEALVPTIPQLAPPIQTSLNLAGQAKHLEAPAEAAVRDVYMVHGSRPRGGLLAVPASIAAMPSAEAVVVTAARRSGVDQYEPGAIVQAGPGVPDWRYHVYPYAWSGPVEESATARFVISPPWVTRLWRLLGLLLAVVLLFELTGDDLPSLPSAWRGKPVSGAGALLLGLALSGAAPRGAHAAATPDPALIDELRTQLLAPPHCTPDCAAVQSAEVSVAAGRLSVLLRVSALDAVGLALPGADPNWAPDVVQVDGAGAGWVERGPQGIRYVSLSRGRHVVRLEGPLGAADAVSLAFPLRPHLIEVNAPDWDAAGVSQRHLVSGALELVRRRSVPDATASARPEEFPPFVVVDRLFHLAHDWTIATTVTRVAPRSAAFTVSLPLLAQEAVTTPGLRAGDGSLTLGMAAGETQQSFNSILPRTEALELLAPRDSAHTERWRFQVRPTWHVDFSGLPAVLPAGDAAVWVFEYYPRPGERLTLKVTRPPALAGGTLAFDRVQLQTVLGQRSSDTTLELHYRSTQGGRQTLRIPADAVVTRVLSDGEPLGLRSEKGLLSLSALPGEHTWVMDWRTPNGVHLVTRSPSLALGAPASNLRLSVRLPEDRWVLYAFGPGVGPTILFWGELLLFVAAAWWLGRSTLTPLPARDWMLLGLGLSTLSWAVLGLFALFIALFAWRARRTAPADTARFNLLQITSAVLALVAIASVVAAVPQGLLAHPDMRIAPAESSGELAWFIDQAADHWPTPGVLSVSLWWYKIAMLAWALWLSFALTRWIPWAWQVFLRDGPWRRAERPAAAVPRPQTP